MDTIAYKIEDRDIWAQAQAEGRYTGSPLDVQDGFIHLSALNQVRETATKWFSGRTNLILAKIDLSLLGNTVIWEASRGGALFPHIYGDLPMAAIVDVVELALEADGTPILAAVFP